MVRSALSCCAMIALCLAAVPLWSQESIQRQIGSDAWVLEKVDGSSRLRHGEVEIELDAVAVFSDLVAGADRWIAAGSADGVGGRELVIRSGSKSEESLSIPPPPRWTQEGDRNQPVLLAVEPPRWLAARSEPVSSRSPALPLPAALELAGISWLEGARPRDHRVWYSLWDGEGFGEPELVAGRAAGSQVALRGALLADGEELLVWTAFDGQDDEVLWSRRRVDPSRGSARWTEPARVSADNSTPDILPALVATESGALLAWSRYDGNHYRLMGAELTGDGWGAPRVLGGRGSLYPSFLRGVGSLLLLFYESDRAGWRLTALGPGFDVVREAGIPGSPASRPVVEGVGPSGARLLLPGDEGPRVATASWRSASAAPR